MSIAGAKRVWIGSRGPHEVVAAPWGWAVLDLPSRPGLEIVDEERFLRLPPVPLAPLVFEPAPARVWEERPALRALTRSLQYVV